MTQRFNAAPVLERLKDFQRHTVEYAFKRMFIDSVPSRRFLVADEVGLGKTLVARGVIAKAVEHLQDNGRRLDIIYICSNADIAAQNVARLNVTGQKAFAKATRLTLLPLEVHNLKDQKINFISFTPGTTFDHGRRSGHKQERRLIYQMLAGHNTINQKGLARALQGSAGEGWYSEIKEKLTFDEPIAEEFRRKMADSELLVRARSLADAISDYRRTMTPELKQDSLRLIGDLRRMLARCCLDALEPDLVILDEFQRFRDLLAPPDSSPSAELAHALFNYSKDLRVLLLSATPYKMYASQHEDEDHYSDFLATTKFLFDDDSVLAELESNLREFRRSLLTVEADTASLERPDESKFKVEQTLKKVMCRTERVGATVALDAMVQERREEVPITPDDILEFRCIDRLSTALGVHDPIEYWRSSPYLLNFMKEYELKRRLTEKKHSSVVAETLQAYPYRTLQKRSIDAYLPIDAANGRLRTLVSDIDQSGSWQLLWVPPSMPYWPGEGPYRNADGFTKTLVFSSWNVVPDAIAGLLSYYVEARSVAGLDKEHRYEQLTKQVRPRLRFPAKQDGSFPGMNALALSYPSQSLADIIDPLLVFMEAGGQTSLSDIRLRARELISKALQPLALVPSGDLALPDRRWYWVALVLLDRHYHPEMQEWCRQRWAMARRSDDPDTPGGFWRHVQHWLDVWTGADLGLGRIPEDLIEVLADMALAGPAVCAFRSLRRLVSQTIDTKDALRSASVHIAEGLRSQLNAPEAIAVLQQAEDEDAYWKRVLHYGAEGNLQAVLDEYVHLQYEAELSGTASESEAVLKVADSIFTAASIRSSQLRPDFLKVADGKLEMDAEPISLRCRYAVRYGQAEDEDGAIARKEVVRAAFNSPFRPFVLASTSVGQEGLDFHSWCHSIVHWNLPSNPVDLEQREGRVHRYKGHAVRKNVAKASRQHGLQGSGDLWERLFALAKKDRPSDVSDLVPYWIYEIPGGAKVERRVFNLPMSKDESRLRSLKSSLALYRMVFGQPRQDDLLEHLLRRFDEQRALQLVKRWRIDLTPAPS